MNTIENRRETSCPRCYETCGWCGDYRHMHGKLTLPGSKKICTLPMHPEGDACPLCSGAMRVIAVTQYFPLAQAIEARSGETAQQARSRSDESAVSEADAPETEPPSPPPSTTEAG